MKNNHGFTLVEVLVALAVGVVILAAVYAVVSTGQKSSSAIERKIVATQDARAAIELMSLEIQMASFNPNYVTGSDFWQDDACGGPVANQLYRGIQVATPTSITVQMDCGASGAIGDNGVNFPKNTNEIITYTYDAANLRITRRIDSATNCGGAQTFLGDTATSGTPRTVRVINTNAVPVFRYFDAQGSEVTAAAGIPSIARIDITLLVETEDVAQDIKQRRRLTYSNSIIPRNHAIQY